MFTINQQWVPGTSKVPDISLKPSTHMSVGLCGIGPKSLPIFLNRNNLAMENTRAMKKSHPPKQTRPRRLTLAIYNGPTLPETKT